MRARKTVTAIAVVAGAQSFATAAPAHAATTAVVRDGAARFEVLTPTLIRLEYAADGSFEDRPTMNAIHREMRAPHYRTTVRHGIRVIRTRALTLRYRRRSGVFSKANLRITLNVSGKQASMSPSWEPGANPGNLGGWFRAFDNDSGPVPLHDGLLSRAGWYLLDDTRTVLLTARSPGFVVRPARTGAYQDGYFFGYGHDYARGLRDLRSLTGAAPLLDRATFGVWFSKYYPYSEQDYKTLLAQFRANRVPLDTLSVDTDFKREGNPLGAAVAALAVGTPGRPFAWNGWEWNSLFPDPPRFLRWAHDEGLSVGLNVHPSISSADPRYAQAQATSGGLIDSMCSVTTADPTSHCGLFDWTNPRHIQAYFDLHAPFERDGADFWWLDWCCEGAQASAPGLTADTQINKLYTERSEARGSRWPAFSRIGGSYQQGFRGQGTGGPFADHRYAIHFTGDNCATWAMLAFEADATAAEGAIGEPYVSHDIGSFNGQPVAGQCNPAVAPTAAKHLAADLYARWVQFATFQPLDRLHSNHGDRLPWEYPGRAGSTAAAFLRLRERLVPYLYTLARESHDSGLPMARKLYLQWPDLDEAYKHASEYTLGKDMLIAPVTSPGDPAPATVWLPPGGWTDYFTGQHYRGPATLALAVPLERLPVYLRDGAVIPTQPDVTHSGAAPQPVISITAYPGANGTFSLYDDDGSTLAYRSGHYVRTRITQRRERGRTVLTIGRARGQSFSGMLTRRAYEVHLAGSSKTQTVTVASTKTARVVLRVR